MSTDSSEKPTVKQKAKRMFRKIIAIAILFGLGAILFVYYANISEGSRAGIVVKISKRGAIFKTFEGQIDVGSFGAIKSSNQLSQTFDFSVFRSDEAIYETLEQVSLTGERVQIKYKEKYGTLPWRGETTYFVYEVVRTSNPSHPEDKKDFPNGN